MISNEQLTELERLCNEASEGPWYQCKDRVCDRGPWYECRKTDCYVFPIANNAKGNARFIAASREAVPQLITEVRSLQENYTNMVEQVEYFRDQLVTKVTETHTTNGRLTGFLQGIAYRLGVKDAMKTQDIEKLMREVKEVLDRQEDDLK